MKSMPINTPIYGINFFSLFSVNFVLKQIEEKKKQNHLCVISVKRRKKKINSKVEYFFFIFLPFLNSRLKIQ